ncbi:hypothetical protein [Nocardioides iriomotensis]|uniref:Nuclear transport factor 2 family protein n=1 Tax=Nocardioides iriomotensis TaxID=715784 RepID=A0A4Q5J311_9ACTN|nr:hypothetical protein [Nocardioides iriomotensis]RYU12753.1 hypothetical protein ETU37_07195 [Nocardioides iriomotensis]
MTRAPVVALAALLLTLAGCTDATETPAAPESTPAQPAPTSAAEPSPSEPPSPPAFGTVVAEDDVNASEGEVTVSDPSQLAVVDAFVRYTQVRLEMLNRAEVDQAALDEVATGEAVTQVTSYADRLARRGEHVVGSIVVNVNRVEVEGTTATIDTCMQNSSVDVDGSGQVVEKKAPAAYLGRVDALQVSSDTWVIADITVDFAEQCPLVVG